MNPIRLNLKNFRNYRDEEILFDEKGVMPNKSQVIRTLAKAISANPLDEGQNVKDLCNGMVHDVIGRNRKAPLDDDITLVAGLMQ